MQEKIDMFLKNIKASDNTAKAYRLDMQQYSAYVAANGNWQEIDTVRSFLQQLEYEGQKETSLARKYTVLKKFYHYCQQQGWIMINPADFMARPKTKIEKPQILDIKEVQLLLDAASPRDRGNMRDKAMIELLYGGGLKISELLSLKISDIDMELECIAVHSHKDRIIPLGREVKKSLALYIEERNKMNIEEDILFLNKRRQPMTRQGAGKILKKYAAEAGIDKEVTAQMLRDSFAAHLLAGGADAGSLKELLGYSSISSAGRFAEFKKSRLRDIYAAAHPRA